MTPRAYLEQLRGALDEYEVAEKEARQCLQERLRKLLGTEIDGPIDSAALLPPASLNAEGATGAGFTPPLPSSATTPPAAAFKSSDCFLCDLHFRSPQGLRVHEARKHKEDLVAISQRTSPSARRPKGGATAGGSDVRQTPTPPAAIDEPAQEPTAVPPPRSSEIPPAPARRSRVDANPRSARPLELAARQEAFVGE